MKKTEGREKWGGGILGTAYMEFGECHFDEKNSFLPIHYVFPQGNQESIDQNSALVRPFKKLLRDGKPVGKVSYVFFMENNECFTLGAFANTSKRLLFFPGIIPKKLIDAPADQAFVDNKTAFVDHISLEENWRNWHISFLEKENTGYKISSKNTKKIHEDTFLWFVMAIKSTNKLETMPKTQEIHLSWPNPSELKRRLSELVASRSKSLFHVTQLDQEVKEEHYFNFEFFLNKVIPKNDVPRIPTVYTAKKLSNSDCKFIEHTRIHPIILQDYVGNLSIRVSKPTGRLNYDGVFIPGKDFL